MSEPNPDELRRTSHTEGHPDVPQSSSSSPNSAPEQFTPLSHEESVASALDQWEALEFRPEAPSEVPHWLLRDLGSLEPTIIGSKLLELQSRLGSALKEIDKLRGTVNVLHRGASLASLPGGQEEEEDQSPGSLWKPVWEGFKRGFALAYFVRAGKLSG